ncbi:hypothetical protein H6F61_20960 [Cyanobacteria bacterium FACHB-472]|nr:hypothetical protein [Cyanobacteria bacterium FACHB-472]
MHESSYNGVAECRYEAIAGTSKARPKFWKIIPIFSNALTTCFGNAIAQS